jgi:hypothetical protein
MTIEDWFDIYEKAARWREMAERIRDRRAAAALRALACELERTVRMMADRPGTNSERASNLDNDG